MADAPRERTIGEKIADTESINRALKRAYYKAVIRHRQANVDMVFGDHGKVIKVSPFDVPIPSDKKP